MKAQIVSLHIGNDADVVVSRRVARQVAEELGFQLSDQARIATAVSEIARNAVVHGGGGDVSFSIEGNTSPQLLSIEVTDRGRGIADSEALLDGTAPASSAALGIVSARRLMDRFQIDTKPGEGTRVLLQKLLATGTPLFTGAAVKQMTSRFSRQIVNDPVEEVRAQNRELVQTLTELRERQEDLVRLNRELEDTNRGVVALYAELDERADYLRRADEMKSRFLSNMSHEFRTPLNSILALSQLLLDRMDGDLSVEQEKQVRFIKKGADTLCELVNDLLDIAKIEAGKVEVHPAEFTIANLFGALRGMLRPLLVSESVTLNIAEPSDLPLMYTDEGKLSQILRNFISNALKFTEAGEIKVTARFLPEEQMIEFAVADTGIGISDEDKARIFEEFEQVNNPLQRKFKGTGLGLTLCRKLANLLGGSISLVSELGRGSTFYATIPVSHHAEPAEPVLQEVQDSDRVQVLIVEDEPEMQLVYERHLRHSPFRPIAARNLREARRALTMYEPRAIVLDIMLPGEGTWEWMTKLKSDDRTRDIPILVATTVDDERKAMALGANDYLAKPIGRDELLATLSRLTRGAGAQTALVIDDDETARYLVRKLLDGRYATLEASDGFSGLKLARDFLPDLILLDLNMPGMNGYTGLQKLEQDVATRAIPVIVITSQPPASVDHSRLKHARAVLFKDALSAEQLEPILESVQQATGATHA